MAMGDTFTKEDCLKAIRNFFHETGSTSSKKFQDYQRFSRPCLKTIIRKFGSWTEAKDAAGLSKGGIKCLD
jgi:hypothetical protein